MITKKNKANETSGKARTWNEKNRRRKASTGQNYVDGLARAAERAERLLLEQQTSQTL